MKVNFDGAKALATGKLIPLGENLSDDFVNHWCHDSVEAIQKLKAWLYRDQ